MSALPRRAMVILSFAASCLAVASPAVGARPGNTRAKKLVKAAMEKDYLDLEFRAAEAKMKKALTICRETGCSKSLHARIYRYLAVVYALGLKDQDAAAFAFMDMLKLSPKLRPDKNFEAPAVHRAFKKAMKQYLKERAEEEREEAKLRAQEEARSSGGRADPRGRGGSGAGATPRRRTGEARARRAGAPGARAP